MMMTVHAALFWFLVVFAIAEAIVIALVVSASYRHKDVLDKLDACWKEVLQIEERYYNRVFDYADTVRKVDQWLADEYRRKQQKKVKK